ncbi:globin domain-containing protein [Planosporangium mesophilum]|uniref:nitric oxide dioxygenase n=1 Tax=Planosporangium mesophilum TaxID=689768 RepID=A0A8J3TH31_9ACTN|nr:globin domain-containing protein [Planosporangium mesophilum]NJC82525.1 flavohemoprotein [Planosporangium mesophilum]GII25471.1 flavohemoprotein [Planosporangium mesophilum]
MYSMSRLLKESWTLVEEQQDKVARHFYARIFLSNPQLRDLFPVQMDVQRARLLGAIVSAVQTVDDPERFDEYLRSLGRDHRKFHAEPEHYDLLRGALLEALRTYAGDQWSLEYEQAWRDGYDRIAQAMIRGAEEDSDTPPFWHAEVIKHERRSRDIAVFTCRPMQAIEYEAGQYLSLETGYQPRLWRMYSPANAMREDNTIDFHVRAIGAGWVSSALVRRLRAGDMLRLAAPMGSMTLDRSSSRDVVFVAGGTGLAPIKALIEELARFNRNRWVHVFFGAKDRDDLYDLEALTEFASRYPWVQVVTACSDDPTWSGEQGNISEVIARYGPWNNHDFFVSGSPKMVKATMRTLAELQVPSMRIKYDAFGDL